jgi:hypothetical protein
MTSIASKINPLIQGRTHPANATAYFPSSITDIESRFFNSLGTYNTSLIQRGFLDFKLNEVVPTPLNSYLVLSPSFIFNCGFSSDKLVSDSCDIFI